MDEDRVDAAGKRTGETTLQAESNPAARGDGAECSRAASGTAFAVPARGGPGSGNPSAETAQEQEILTLHAETATVQKRARKTLVRARRTTSERTVVVDEDLAQDSVVIERVAIGRVVEAVPPVRQEGDITIIPVVEEELVVVRRLVLREEVHLRRVTSTTRHTETVTLREQTVTVTRTEVTD